MLSSDLSQVASLEPQDVVIVGGGAAGLTLAHALSGKGLSILVLEAGGEKPNKRSARLLPRRGNRPACSSWYRPLSRACDRWRRRGTGVVNFVPLDPIDFRKREWVPRSGWPITFETLKPYYERAVLEAEGGKYPLQSCRGPSEITQRELVKGLDGILLTTTIEQFSKPTNFWRHFGESLRRSKDVRLY